jgi:hypothetical protein
MHSAYYSGSRLPHHEPDHIRRLSWPSVTKTPEQQPKPQRALRLREYRVRRTHDIPPTRMPQKRLAPQVSNGHLYPRQLVDRRRLWVQFRVHTPDVPVHDVAPRLRTGSGV